MKSKRNLFEIASLLITTTILISVILLFPGKSNPQECDCKCELKLKFPLYLGFDYQLNRMKFKKGYGDNMFPKHHSQINIYSSLGLNESYRVELGYMSTISKTRYSTLKTGDSCLGVIVPNVLSPAVFKSYIRIKGYHINFLKVFSPLDIDKLKILSSCGVGFLRADAIRNCLSLGLSSIPGNIRYFKKHKPVLRLMIASEYKFKNNLGIRCSFCFLNTRTIKIKSIYGNHSHQIKPNNSIIYSLGMFYRF